MIMDFALLKPFSRLVVYYYAPFSSSVSGRLHGPSSP